MLARMGIECPKCGATSAWYRREGPDLLLRCLCGYLAVMATTLEEVSLIPSAPRAAMRVPRWGTNLWYVLMVTVALEESTTHEIRERLAELGKVFSLSEVASALTVMRSKGLVEATIVRRRIAGGSTWRASERCLQLLEV